MRVERSISMSAKTRSDEIDRDLFQVDAISTCSHPTLKHTKHNADIADDLEDVKCVLVSKMPPLPVENGDGVIESKAEIRITCEELKKRE